MRFVLLHYHFLKNAGMTVFAFLMRSFGDGCAEVDTPDRDGHVACADLLALLERKPEVKAVTSHQIRYPVPAVPGYIFFDLCFLRDPIDRLRSMYYYFRAKPQPGDPVSDFACSSGMGDFLAQMVDRMPWYIADAQVNLIANGIANDIPTEHDLERALARVLNTSFLGVVDMYTESLIAGQYFLNPVFPEARLCGTSGECLARHGEDARRPRGRSGSRVRSGGVGGSPAPESTGSAPARNGACRGGAARELRAARCGGPAQASTGGRHGFRLKIAIQLPIHLGAKLFVSNGLKEAVMLRRSDESRSPEAILPKRHYRSIQTFGGSTALQCVVEPAPGFGVLALFQCLVDEHGHDFDIGNADMRGWECHHWSYSTRVGRTLFSCKMSLNRGLDSHAR